MALRYEDPPSRGALRQGEILADAVEHRVTYPAIGPPATEPVPVIPIPHPLAVVLSNVCDLQQDFDARAEQEEPGTESGAHAEPLPGQADVQTADREVEPEEHQSLVRYVHLCDLMSPEQVRRRDPSFKEKYLDRLRKHEILRYHHFPPAAVGGGDPLPEFFLDFQKVFAVPTQSLYHAMRAGGVRRICVVPPIYMHALIQRYHAFQSRVGLP